jgi:hypothetical protein
LSAEYVFSVRVRYGTCVTVTEVPPEVPCLSPGVPGGMGVCDGFGTCVQCWSPNDCPPDPNQCHSVSCDTYPGSGQCFDTDAPAGTMCNQNGGTVCNTAATCVQCNVASDCPPTGSECIVPTCESIFTYTCGTTFAPAGTVCSQGGTSCDGAGNCL